MKRYIGIPTLLFLIVFLVGILSASHIGVSWDEPDNMYSAGRYTEFFRRGFDPSVFNTWDEDVSYFEDKIFANDRFVSHLPPIHNYLGLAIVLGAERLGVDMTAPRIITAFHISGAFFYGLLVAFVYLFGRLLKFPQELSIFAALTTYLYPTMFGHGYSVTKDIAQSSLFVTSMFFLVRYRLSAVAKRSRRDIYIGALVWGLALASKFNAIYIPVIWGIWSMGLALTQKTHKLKNSRRVVDELFLLGGIGLVTVFVLWPYLWFEPVAHTREVVEYFTSVGRGYKFIWNGIVYFSGLGVSYWWYPLGSFLLQTPELLLTVVAIGLLRIVLRRTRDTRVELMSLWVVIPAIRYTFPSASLYDQLRHYMEALPAVMLLTTLGIDVLVKHIRSTRIKQGIYVFLFAVIVQMLFLNITLAPYSAGYYNVFTPDPNNLFDRDIEGLSIKEGVDYLHKKYGSITLWAPVSGHQSWYYLTKGDQYVYTTLEADSIILINKAVHVNKEEFEKSLAGTGFELVHTIRRGEAEFGWVYRKK